MRIFDDALIEGTETFQLRLSNPSGGAVLGSGMYYFLLHDTTQGKAFVWFKDNF